MPLPARAVLVRAAAARQLAHHLLGWESARLAPLRACVGDDLMVVLGDDTCLPWVDQAIYLGHDPAAPGLLLPTNRGLNVPVDLFAEALTRRVGRGPWAVLPADSGGLVAVPIAPAGPIARDQLEAWVMRARS